MKVFHGLLAMTALLATPAAAQSDDILQQIVRDQLVKMTGTLFVRSDPYFHGGALTGCQLVYETITQDWTYRQGGYIRADGSLSIMAMQNGEQRAIGATMKTVINQISVNQQNGIEFIPSPPSRTYLVGRGLKTNLSSVVDSYQTDTPGALFVILQLSPTIEMLMDGFLEKRLTIAFNQFDKGTDVNLTIELDVENTDNNGIRLRSGKAVTSFIECATLLSNEDN
ncbi:hypothetical protein ACUSIJ_25045 [Pseudochelatococcus sp. B33]